jgi:hypothetical protein
MDGNRLEIIPDATEGGTPHAKDTRRALALAFCRECLGWPDASYQSRCIFENRPRPESSHVSGKMHGFQIDAHDLGHLLNAVKEWCDIHAVPLSLEYCAGQKDAWRVRIAQHAEVQSADPCDALLRACLTAHGEIRARNDDRTAIEVMPIRRNPALLENPWGNIGENAPTALSFCKECLGWDRAGSSATSAT